ncbi:MAG TPA: ferritin-like domain-containing protein [Myxococcales bacterium]|jgi:ferritin-like metal-binding protein YciE
MSDAFDTGLNRTGIATSPIDSPDVLKGAQVGLPVHSSVGRDAAAARRELAREAEPIGHVPLPASLKGMAKTAMTALKGEKASVFIDKLGERLAFERSGTRLYELVLLKGEAYPTWEGGPAIAELREHHDEELAHFGLLQECLTQLGADPTAMTPSADLAINLSIGLPQVLSDPRTSLRECLEGVLIAELADNACWETLIELARELGQSEMATRFEHALRNEQQHLRRVQGWVRTAVLNAATPRRQDDRPAAH